MSNNIEHIFDAKFKEGRPFNEIYRLIKLSL